MANLDDAALYARLDPSGFGGRIASMPAQCRDAWLQALAFPLPDSYRRVERVLVLGMGGSAIGGEMLSDVQSFMGVIPVDVPRDYGPLGPADDQTLVVASSYSGNTEETLSAFDKVWRPGLKTVACTTGGALAAQCAIRGVPVFPIAFKGEPRSALGYGLFSLLGFLNRLGLGQDLSSDVLSSIKEMESFRREVAPEAPSSRNPAKQMAARAHGKAVLVCGAQHLSAAARRWKSQIAENAKGWAFFELLPELNHNTIEGTRFPAKAANDLVVVMLLSGLYSPRIALRCQLTREILAEEGFASESVTAKGESPLTQIMTTVLFGDYLSYYLAMLNGVDPSVVPNLDRIKAGMASR